MQLVTEKELADYLGITRWQARDLRKADKIIPEHVINENIRPVRLYDKNRWAHLLVDKSNK